MHEGRIVGEAPAADVGVDVGAALTRQIRDHDARA